MTKRFRPLAAPNPPYNLGTGCCAGHLMAVTAAAPLEYSDLSPPTSMLPPAQTRRPVASHTNHAATTRTSPSHLGLPSASGNGNGSSNAHGRGERRALTGGHVREGAGMRTGAAQGHSSRYPFSTLSWPCHLHLTSAQTSALVGRRALTALSSSPKGTPQYGVMSPLPIADPGPSAAWDILTLVWMLPRYTPKSLRCPWTFHLQIYLFLVFGAALAQRALFPPPGEPVISSGLDFQEQTYSG